MVFDLELSVPADAAAAICEGLVMKIFCCRLDSKAYVLVFGMVGLSWRKLQVLQVVIFGINFFFFFIFVIIEVIIFVVVCQNTFLL